MSTKNKRTNYLFIGSLVVLAIFVILAWNQQNEKKQLTQTSDELSHQVALLEKEAKEKNIDLHMEVEQTREQNEEEIIITEEQVAKDTELAEAFFTPAFDWRSGEQYDEMRQQYISLLGEDSSFVETYIVEDTKIATDDGELSYIDQQEVKSYMHSLTAIPIEIEGKNRIRYVAFIVHYMHQDKQDLVNLDALNESEAIVEFSIVEDDKNEVREIVDVEAWNLL